MTKKYNKLVRDKVIQHILDNGGDPKHHTATEEELPRLSFEKVHEELKELAEAETHEKRTEEAGDVLEAFDLLCEYLGLSKTEVEKAKIKKALERGQFKKRIVLDES